MLYGLATGDLIVTLLGVGSSLLKLYFFFKIVHTVRHGRTSVGIVRGSQQSTTGSVLTANEELPTGHAWPSLEVKPPAKLSTLLLERDGAFEVLLLGRDSKASFYPVAVRARH